MIKYSIHTLELLAQLSPDDYNNIYSVLSNMRLSIDKMNYSLIKKHSQRIYTYRHFTGYAGINSISLLTDIVKDCSTKHYVHIYINPYNAFYKCQHSGADIIEERKIAAAMNIIQTHLDSLFPFFPSSAYSLKRLDFCLDIKFPEQKQADEYIQLLKKVFRAKFLRKRCISIKFSTDSYLIKIHDYCFANPTHLESIPNIIK